MAPTLRKRRRQSDTVIEVSSSASSSSESEITEDSGSEEDEDTDEESPSMRHKRRAISVEEDDGDVYDRVVDLVKSGKHLDVLKLEECRAYLRKLKLRVSGTKAICVQRIQEHWRIKDGYGEKLYPYSSFFINCTGDVCKGDVVLFKQRVYEEFDKISKTGKIIGKRTIAGRVVKESYGATKQQHTFTVEILWSKGQKALPALFPLLVKGRNLYRMKTFRQRWEDETERLKALNEKHQRGAAARHTRAITKASYVNRGLKPQISSIRSSSKTQRKMAKVSSQSEEQNKGDGTNVQQRGNKKVGQPSMSKVVQQSSVRLGHLPSDHNIPHSGQNPVNDSFSYNRSNVPPFWIHSLHGEHSYNNYQHGWMPLPAPFTNSPTSMQNNYGSRFGSLHPIHQSNLSYFYQGGMDPSFPWLTQEQSRGPPPAPYGRPYHWHY